MACSTDPSIPMPDELATAVPEGSPMYEWRETRYCDRRFDLVKIAFEKTLEVQIQFADPNEMGRGIVALADAVLAAMEKEPEGETPDV